MKKIRVIYWTQSGNTQIMAQAVAKGITEAGAEACVYEVCDADAKEVLGENAFALGCPAMGAEELEETEMEPFVETLEKGVSDKRILLFGSYGWGDGEWMRNWVQRMKEAGAEVVEDEGIICMGEPDSDIINRCVELGRVLAQGE